MHFFQHEFFNQWQGSNSESLTVLDLEMITSVLQLPGSVNIINSLQLRMAREFFLYLQPQF
jgi:hypothetical protein